MTDQRKRHDLNRLQELVYSAVIADICDAEGMRDQTLEPGMQHLAGPTHVLVGYARTAISKPQSSIPEIPYSGEIRFVDSLSEGDVVVIDCTGSSAAAWGELFSTAASARGARGALIDGLIRDTAKINELGRFPVYGRGARPTDALGRIGITEVDIPVCAFGQWINQGDLIVCDPDGVTVVPKGKIDSVVELALNKVATEDNARELLFNGGFLRDVWNRFGVM